MRDDFIYCLLDSTILVWFKNVKVKKKKKKNKERQNNNHRLKEIKKI